MCADSRQTVLTRSLHFTTPRSRGVFHSARKHRQQRIAQRCAAGANAGFPLLSEERSKWAVLNFPNQSRVFDATRRAVRFWGHDSALEWSFFVTEDALKQLQPKMARNEASLLHAFDTNRAAIYAAAMKAFKRERKGSYELTAVDF